MVGFHSEHHSVGQRNDGSETDVGVRSLERGLGEGGYPGTLFGADEEKEVGFVVDVLVDVGLVESVPKVDEFG